MPPTRRPTCADGASNADAYDVSNVGTDVASNEGARVCADDVASNVGAQRRD